MNASFFDHIFKRQNKQSKKTYLLLEILIAMTLLSMMSGLFIGGPSKLIEREIASLEQMELERIADGLFLEWKRSLYKNGASWSELANGYRAALPSFSIPEVSKRKWEPQLYLKVDKKKIDDQNLESYFSNVVLTIKSGKYKHDFFYDLTIQQIPKKT